MSHKYFVLIFLLPLALFLIVAIGYIVLKNTDSDNQRQNIINVGHDKKDIAKSGVTWEYDYNSGDWNVRNTPPECSQPLKFSAPVDVNLASGILYPGQLRGGDYKPHGGLRFDNRDDNSIELRTIMDGYILKAAKYNDGYGEQVLIFYVNDCGIMVMHDHLLTLSPKLEVILKDVVVRKGGDSRTTMIEPRIEFKKGELLATEVGYRDFPGGRGGKNIFVDFGLYDLRDTNGVDYTSSFRSKHPNINEYGTHALCWFDVLSQKDEKVVRNLPAGGSEGTESDYCN